MGESITIDPWAPCPICDRKISMVAPWLPYLDGIAHADCIQAEFLSWCGDNSEPVNDESFRALADVHRRHRGRCGVRCPVCGTDGYRADPVNGWESCQKRACVVNERPCLSCDATGYTLAHPQDCHTKGHPQPGCPEQEKCPRCNGARFILAADLPLEVTW